MSLAVADVDAPVVRQRDQVGQRRAVRLVRRIELENQLAWLGEIRLQRLDLGRSARERLREQGERLRVDGIEPAGRVAERAAQHKLHRPAQERGAEAVVAAGNGL